MSWLLALDVGTQSARALVFDTRGELIARVQERFDPVYHAEQPGWAEQDADLYWQAIARACRQLWQQGIDPQRLRGVALTTQRGTVVAVDEQGQPLRPAITWLDQREVAKVAVMPQPWRSLLATLGVSDAVERFRRQAECVWMAQNESELWARTHKFLLLSGYLNYRLCGEYVDAVSAQVGYLPFDFKRQAWERPWSWKWSALPVRPQMLPRLFEPAHCMGMISARAAAETGLPQGLALIAAGADKACEVLGSGCLEPHMGAISYGTTATINTTQGRYYEVRPLLPAYPAAVPQAYLTEVQTFRGFWMVQWFKEQFGHPELQRAEDEGLIVESLFDDLLRETPAGAMGLMLQPYWTPGVREPGREAKGAMIGFGDVHERAHVYRAIIEGLAYSLREGRAHIEKRTGRRIKVLRVSGGGSQSDEVMRITADIMGLVAERPHTYETSGLGAAMNIAVGLGLHANHAQAVAAMCRVGERFVPDPQRQQLYHQLYERVWSRMYERLRPLYHELRSITGYPD